MIRWTKEKDMELHNIVMTGNDISDGLNMAADALGSTFFCVRNRWYHPKLKAMRGEVAIEKKRPTTDEAPSVKLRAAMILLQEAIDIQTEENDLASEIKQLKQENDELQNRYKELLDEYNVIYRVIQRAREITVRQDLGEVKKSSFKMDANGNLESVKDRYWGNEAVGEYV